MWILISIDINLDIWTNDLISWKMATAYFQEGCRYRNDSTEVPSTPDKYHISLDRLWAPGLEYLVMQAAYSLLCRPTHKASMIFAIYVSFLVSMGQVKVVFMYVRI